MHPQLELLLEIQDLRAQSFSLHEVPDRTVESKVFDVEIEDAIRLLDEKVVELEDRLSPEVQQRYRMITEKGDRAVVPVLSGICYGCFINVPTAWSSEADRNRRMAVCENCGRFLYHVD
jgi:predicted  nucleic acid-binding Zn-ribbon protein